MMGIGNGSCTTGIETGACDGSSIGGGGGGGGFRKSGSQVRFSSTIVTGGRSKRNISSHAIATACRTSVAASAAAFDRFIPSGNGCSNPRNPPDRTRPPRGRSASQLIFYFQLLVFTNNSPSLPLSDPRRRIAQRFRPTGRVKTSSGGNFQ